jgi:alkylhydroperoxidase family enzyme
MTDFTLHKIEDATEDRKKVLEKAKGSMGIVPNMIAGLAESPQAADAYMALSHFFVKSSLTKEQRHVVWFTVNAEHDCEYCMAGHSMIAKLDQIDDSVVETARAVGSYDDPKLEALRKFTLAMVQKRGWLDPEEVDAFLTAGYTKQNVFDVLIGVAHKTMSNYANHIINTPLDPGSSALAWKKPAQDA